MSAPKPGGCYVANPLPMLAPDRMAALWMAERERTRDRRMAWAIAEAITAALFGWLP